jgi:hypothetical protein
MKVEKLIITPKWFQIKSMYEAETNGSSKYGTNFEIGGELDLLAEELIHMLGEITQKMGFDCVVEGVKMDLWKERIWTLVENAGLLPEIAWRDELEEEIKDTWNEYDSEFDVDLEEKSFEVFGFGKI